MATKPAQNRKRKQKPAQPQQEPFQDGFLRASELVGFIQGQLSAIGNACKHVSENSGNPDAPSNCASYYNGAKKLADIIIAALIAAPRTDAPQPEQPVEEVH